MATMLNDNKLTPFFNAIYSNCGGWTSGLDILIPDQLIGDMMAMADFLMEQGDPRGNLLMLRITKQDEYPRSAETTNTLINLFGQNQHAWAELDDRWCTLLQAGYVLHSTQIYTAGNGVTKRALYTADNKIRYVTYEGTMSQEGRGVRLRYLSRDQAINRSKLVISGFREGHLSNLKFDYKYNFDSLPLLLLPPSHVKRVGKLYDSAISV